MRINFPHLYLFYSNSINHTIYDFLNAVYSGPWCNDARKKFSKTKCVAYQMGNQFMNGVPLRQDYLETVLRWISNDNIKDYMARHQFELDATELWQYFSNVISWVTSIFPTYRKEMKGLPWGFMFNAFKDKPLHASELDKQISILMEDDEVKNKRGIYEYVLTNDEKYLNLRTFDNSVKRTVYEKQKGICTHCGKHFEINEMEADHIIPWSKGGKTEIDNCQMLCKECNRKKSNN